MQTNDRSVEPAIIETYDAAAAADGDPSEPASGRTRRRRPRDGPTERVSRRFTPADRTEVDAAASAGMSTSRFCGEAAPAAARGTPMLLAAPQDCASLALLQRQFGSTGRAGR